MSQLKRVTTKSTPLRLLLVLLLSAFAAEFAIMLFFLFLSPLALNERVVAVMDSTVLSSLLFPVLYFVVFRPLTRQVKEFEQAERELERTQAILQDALRAKSEFMNNVTHELRTPLNSVIGFAELLKHEVPGPLNARQAEFAADILAGGQRLLALVDGILEVSRLDAATATLKRESVAIGATIEERMAAHHKATQARGVSLRLAVASDAGSAELDPQALRRMLDAGLARRHGGVGMGLALARRLAEWHGGTIKVESEPGKGSLFTLRLPLQEKS